MEHALAGIEGYRPSKQNGKLHAARTESVEPKPRYNGAGEAEVVPGYQLAPVIREWVVRWLAERPSDTEVDKTRFMGPWEWLSEKTGLPVRRISGMANEEFPTVGLSRADKVLSAMGKQHLLGGEIQVVQSPNWSLEKWMEYMQERGCI